nr:hypothetical protein [Pseudomonas sp. WCS374]
MSSNNGLADSEPHAHAAALGSEKRLEYFFLIVTGYTRAAVLDAPLQPLFIACSTDDELSTFIAMRDHGIHCIAYEIEQQLLDLHLIARNQN